MSPLQIDKKKSEANSRRKKEHLDIVLNNNMEVDDVGTGLDDFWFIHQALPDIDFDNIDLSTDMFGKKLEAPLFISPMVGGIESRMMTTSLDAVLPALSMAVIMYRFTPWSRDGNLRKPPSSSTRTLTELM